MTKDQVLLHAFGLEELLGTPHSNGYAYHLVCFGCGAQVGTNRHAANTRAWCDDCKAAGKPNSQRQKDLRAKRRQSQ